MLPPPKTRMMACYKLKESIDRGQTDFNAPYQRDIVWNTVKQEELLDSIFNNFYIPPLLFAIRKIKNKNARVIIDGKQRLTSILRFMNNEIPYVDKSSGEERPLYYSDENDSDEVVATRDYLDEDQMSKFTNFEFVCMEYSNITEDDEFDIFSRVQLGVTITSAEKLKAHNTPIAKVCRRLAEKYSSLSKILLKSRSGPAGVFQSIAHMALTIKNDTDDFKSTLKHLTDFIEDPSEPSRELVESLERVLQILCQLIDNETLLPIFTTRNNAKCPLKYIELLILTKFIASVERTRTLKDYSEDIKTIRNHVFLQKEGRLYLGKECFAAGMLFADQRLSDHHLTPADRCEENGRQRYARDEIKYDDTEPEEIMDSTHSLPHYQPAGKRRRTQLTQRPKSVAVGTATARRGGKSVSFDRR